MSLHEATRCRSGGSHPCLWLPSGSRLPSVPTPPSSGLGGRASPILPQLGARKPSPVFKWPGKQVLVLGLQTNVKWASVQTHRLPMGVKGVFVPPSAAAPVHPKPQQLACSAGPRPSGAGLGPGLRGHGVS